MDNSSMLTDPAKTVDMNDSTDLIRDYLDDKLSMDPIAEPDMDDHDEYYDVGTAAQLLGKSIRQVQRLLKEGKLVGHKTVGRKGLEWKIDRENLAFQLSHS